MTVCPNPPTNHTRMKTQHLLDCIDAFSAKSSANEFLNSIELKSLIQDIREDAVHGVQEFYETLERIANELRGMTEHSAAFLSRVRKAEAPNYYDIIKKPMDLGTVLKKVKTQQYKDKKSFADDLTLIWDNCLEYNTYLEHPLRKSANILRNKTNQLLQFVTEMPTKQAAPASGAARAGSVVAASDADAEGDTDEEADETDRTRKGRTSHKQASKQLKREDDASEAIQQLARTRENSMAFVGANDGGVDIDSPYEATPELSRSRSPSVDLRRFQKRKSLAARTDLVPFEERPALLRTPQAMTDFEMLDQEQDDSPVASTSNVTLDSPHLQARAKPLPLAVQQLSGRHSRSVSEDFEPPELEAHKGWWEDFNTDMHLRAGLPAVPFSKCAMDEISLRLPKYQAGSIDGMRQIMASNLNKIQKIKALNQKMEVSDLLYAQSGDVSTLNQEDDFESESPRIFQPLGQPHVARSFFSTPHASEAATSELQIAVGALIAHGGFDTIEKSAFDILTSAVARYLSTLGKTLRTGIDLYSNRLSGPHLLQHALSQNGIDSPAELSSYVEQDVKQLSSRLDEAWATCVAKRKQQTVKLQKMPRYTSVTEDITMDAQHLQDGTLRYIRYEPTEPFVSLESTSEDERLAAIEAQVGLLRPFLLARMKTDYKLLDDIHLKNKGKPKPKIEASGRIPTPLLKRKHSAGSNTSKKQKITKETKCGD